MSQNPSQLPFRHIVRTVFSIAGNSSVGSIKKCAWINDRYFDLFHFCKNSCEVYCICPIISLLEEKTKSKTPWCCWFSVGANNVACLIFLCRKISYFLKLCCIIINFHIWFFFIWCTIFLFNLEFCFKNGYKILSGFSENISSLFCILVLLSHVCWEVLLYGNNSSSTSHFMFPSSYNAELI